MTNIIKDIKVIEPGHWEQETDGLWYMHIPFEANSEDTLLEFVDPEEYIQEHKIDFDALNSGFTTNTECIITADHRPSCNIAVQIKFCKNENGEIIYKPDNKGNFVPEWRSNAPVFGGLRAFAETFANNMIEQEHKNEETGTSI